MRPGLRAARPEPTPPDSPDPPGPPDPPDLLPRERVRLERRIQLDRLERPLLVRIAVDRTRDVVRQPQAVDGAVVVEEHRDVDDLRRVGRRQRRSVFGSRLDATPGSTRNL